MLETFKKNTCSSSTSIYFDSGELWAGGASLSTEKSL